jgi:stage V sporulation protein SpoVS
MSDTGTTYLDGNSVAGPLAGVFAVDLTAAVGGCAGCGAVAVLAAARVYPDAPGLVVRCASCNAVLIRIVEAPERTWLDLRGVAYLEVATGSS